MVIQFDRGFDSKELKYFFIKNNYPYLIHSRKHKGKIIKLVKETRNVRQTFLVFIKLNFINNQRFCQYKIERLINLYVYIKIW